ncbi:DUF1127 domain-containing protein [Aminobacter sp. BE322]|uniref:DUF1127 domain-containing protein n=1 Tax=unclassified Aminobacter TaxID=2644704 RepID=UPI003D204AE3
MAYSAYSGHKLPASGFTARFVEAAATRFAAIGDWCRLARTRRAIEALGPEQLKDIGYPSVEAKPSMEVERGLMIRLATMR